MFGCRQTKWTYLSFATVQLVDSTSESNRRICNVRDGRWHFRRMAQIDAAICTAPHCLNCAHLLPKCDVWIFSASCGRRRYRTVTDSIRRSTAASTTFRRNRVRTTCDPRTSTFSSRLSMSNRRRSNNLCRRNLSLKNIKKLYCHSHWIGCPIERELTFKSHGQ